MSLTAAEVQAFHSYLNSVDWTYNYSDDITAWRRGEQQQTELKQQCEEHSWKHRHFVLYKAMRKILQDAWENAGYGKNHRLYYRQAYLNMQAFVDTVEELYKDVFSVELARYQKERIATCSDEEYTQVSSIYLALTKELYEHRDKLNLSIYENYVERHMRDYLKLWPDARADLAPTFMIGVSINHVALPMEIYDAIKRVTLDIRKLGPVESLDIQFHHKVMQTVDYLFSEEVPEYRKYCANNGRWGPWFSIQPKYLITSSISRSTDCEFSSKAQFKLMNCLPAFMVGKLGFYI
jgi:hypothetical protein